MIDRFAELLQELGKIVDQPLHPDSKESCTLLISEKIRVQLGLERSQERLLIGSHIGIVPPGKFRENLLAHAMKVNNIYPRVGTFGYSPYHNQLALFEFLPLTNLNGEKLADFLGIFIAKSLEWQDALQTGSLPPLSLPEGPKPQAPFPLR